MLSCAGASDNLCLRKNGDGGKNCGIGDLSWHRGPGAEHPPALLFPANVIFWQHWSDFTHLPSNFSHILPICLTMDRNKSTLALNYFGLLLSSMFSLKQIRPCSKGFQYTAILRTNNEGGKVSQHLTVLETSATAQTEVNWIAEHRKCDTTVNRACNGSFRNFAMPY